MLSNKILKKYKKNKQSYLIITNQYGGGTKEIYNEFIKHNIVVENKNNKKKK